MFENMMNFFKKLGKKEKKQANNSKDAAKERLHLVLIQDRANVSADFLELMKQEIIEVIKKYIDVDEREIDVRLTNKENGDGTNGAPALYANIPILNIKNESRKIELNKEESKKDINNDAKKDNKTENSQTEKIKDKEENKKILKQENDKKTSGQKQNDDTTKFEFSSEANKKQKETSETEIFCDTNNKQKEIMEKKVDTENQNKKTKEKIKSEN